MARDLVLLGASAGGTDVLRSILSELPAKLGASVLIVRHTSSDAPAMLAKLLDLVGPLPVVTAANGEVLEKNCVYVAPPNLHLLVRDGHVRTVHGPRENRARPAVDPLFRTAAASRGPRVVAGVLSGWLDDGAAGLLDVKECGGATFVQDPEEAEAPDMPLAAIEVADPPDVARTEAIPALIRSRLAEEVPSEVSIPESIRREAERTFQRGGHYPFLEDHGEPVGLSCPDCGGPMWQVGRGGQHRLRCHTGHALAEHSLLAAQSAEIERALGTALRVLEERVRMWRRVARDPKRAKMKELAEQRLAESQAEAYQVRLLLTEPEPHRAAES